MSCDGWRVDSTEYLPISVRADVALGSQPVEAAFLADEDADPQESDWVEAIWDTGVANQVLVLVGPDGGVFVFTPGRWYTYVRVDAPPEKPVIYAGPLTVE